MSLVNKIIFLPNEFKRRKDITFYSLLKETDYFKFYNEISEDSIVEEFNKHPGCINDWLSFSEDKRSSSGWYLIKDNSGNYIVGYYPPIDDYHKTEYKDRVKACAAFIKREIEEIRKL